MLLALLGWIQFQKWQALQEIKPWLDYTLAMYWEERIAAFRTQRHRWPSSLADVADSDPEIDPARLRDSWGRALLFIPFSRARGFGEIVCLGRDGRRGGEGQTRDVIVRFPDQEHADWNERQGKALPRWRFPP